MINNILNVLNSVLLIFDSKLLVKVENRYFRVYVYWNIKNSGKLWIQRRFYLLLKMNKHNNLS